MNDYVRSDPANLEQLASLLRYAGSCGTPYYRAWSESIQAVADGMKPAQRRDWFEGIEPSYSIWKRFYTGGLNGAGRHLSADLAIETAFPRGDHEKFIA